MSWEKYGHLRLPGIFLDKLIADIIFKDEAVVQCYVPFVKFLLKMLVLYK